DYNTVAGNYIGTNLAGTAGLPNAIDGVYIGSAAHNNTVGGTANGTGNVIAGNTGSGVIITDANTNNNLVLGNLIGTNAAGTAALGNGADGVGIMAGASNNIIGGATAAARNIISGNGRLNVFAGVFIGSGGNPSGNQILGNYIGTDISGLAALGNANSGIILSGAGPTTVTGNIIS